MFKYNSVQTHSDFKNGKLRTKTTRVTIRGQKGTKSVEVLEKSPRKKLRKTRSKKRLTAKEIKCIKNCQFVPGLFKDCWDCIKNK
jgi:hypothetical protein